MPNLSKEQSVRKLFDGGSVIVEFVEIKMWQEATTGIIVLTYLLLSPDVWVSLVS